MKNILLSIVASLLFVGCGGDTVVNGGDTNVTVVMPPDGNTTVNLPIIVVPVDTTPTLGYINNQYPVYENGTYQVNAPEFGHTFYVTNIMDVNSTLTVNPKLVNTVFDVILYDKLYERIDPVEYINRWTFLVPARGNYHIELVTYEKVEVVMSNDGWTDKY